jgi:uncharacterized protein with HEPN domain
VKTDVPYLGHIADSIAAIESFVAGGRAAFLRERMIQDAVIRNFEVIGEAASRLSPALRDQPGLPWGKIIAFRNRLIHGYWSVDLPLVWDVVVHDLPKMKAEVTRFLSDLGSAGGLSGSSGDDKSN